MSTQPTQDTFRNAAKKRMVDHGLTVTALAKRLGFARNTVSMAINHPILPTVRRKVAKHLKMEVPS